MDGSLLDHVDEISKHESSSFFHKFQQCRFLYIITIYDNLLFLETTHLVPSTIIYSLQEILYWFIKVHYQYKKRRCGMIGKEKILHKRPNDTEINNYTL